jgi:hypothetical protein
VTPCAIYTVHMEMRSTGFLVEPQTQGRWFVSVLSSKPLVQFISGLTLKPLRRFVCDLASKPLGQFSPIWPQNR